MKNAKMAAKQVQAAKRQLESWPAWMKNTVKQQSNETSQKTKADSFEKKKA